MGQWYSGSLESCFPQGYLGSIPGSGVLIRENYRTKRIKKYRGKVTRIGRKYLGIILFGAKGEEDIIGKISKDLFPQEGYKIGQIFDYTSSTRRNEVSVSYKLVEVKPVTNEDITKLRRRVLRQFKGIDLNQL